MWQTATATDAFRAAIADATTYRSGIVRLFGIPESEIANTLRAAEADGLELDPLEITTCLRRGEIEIATRYEPPAAGRLRRADRISSPPATATRCSPTTARRSTSRWPACSTERAMTLAVAESCTGGLMAARLTDRAGSSAFFSGGIVAYSNEAKIALVGVEAALIERVGAVSTEVAEALADGAIERFNADLGIGITGIAGPGGGTEDKPVGTVCFSVASRAGGARSPAACSSRATGRTFATARRP